MNVTRVAIDAEGRNPERLLGALQRESVRVGDFCRKSAAQFRFYVQKKDLQKTFAILEELCYTYSASRLSAGGAYLMRLAKRGGLFVGILVFSLLVALSRGYVWRIRITGNEVVPDKVIENVLAQHNIKVGASSARFDADELSTAVRAIDGVTLASVYKTGTTVYVEVFESEPPAPSIEYSDVDIVSRYDATVTRIVCREGTPLVQPGQHVFAGTPLIGAYRLSQEGERIPARASGTVYGNVSFTETVTVATEWYEYEPVKTYARTRIGLFGLTLGKAPPSGDGIFVTETAEKFNAFLPITVRRAQITEMRKRKMSAPIEQLAERAQDEVLSGFVHAEIPSVTATHAVRELGGGLYRVNIFISAQDIPIG